jgi:putative heme-binding domain-containing protein
LTQPWPCAYSSFVKSALVGITILLSAAVGQDRNPLHGNKDAIEAGRGMFRIYCSPCHGIEAQGGRGPDLTLGLYSTGNDDQALFRVIAAGAAGTEMPGYSDRFDADGIWRLVAFIRSKAGRPAPQLSGDRGNGEKLFWGRGGCGACHRIGQRGNRMGPELGSVGRTRSLEYLKESLLEPNASLTPGYNTVVVVTRDGRKISGVQRGYDAFSAQLMDVHENYHSFFREEVQSMDREFKSMMPAYGKLLSERELNDVLLFLTSLRGEGESR